jgi:hypothetical protein
VPGSASRKRGFGARRADHLCALEADARAIIEERAHLIGELRALVRPLGGFADGVAGSYPSAPAPPQADETA